MAANISTAMGVIMTNVQEYQTSIANITNDTVDAVPTEPGNKEALALTRLIVQRILVPVITSIGLFGNIISICVLTQKCMVSSTNCYLTTLSVFDLLYLVFSFTLSLKHYKGVKVLDVYLYIYPYTRVLTDICSNVSVCLTVTFSAERLIAVCYPMKGRTICTPERARIITIIITVCAMVCTAPEFFEWKTVHISENNITKVAIMNSDLADTVSYQVGYNYFLIFTFTVLPLILLSTFNGILIKSVLVATRIRRQLTYNSIAKEPGKRHHEQTRITLMLIGVVVVFLVCQFPNAAVLLYTCYIELKEIDLTREDVNHIIIAGNVVNLLVLINASVNFVLYSVMSTKFRRVFIQMFCRLIHRKREPYSRTEMTYYNSSFAKSQTSPLRYRSKRLTSISGNGLGRQVSNKCGYTTCATGGSDNLWSGCRDGSLKRSSEIKNIREPVKRSMSRNISSRRMSSKDGLYRIHNIEKEITIWECVTALEDTQSEQAEESVCDQSREQRPYARFGSFEIVQSHVTGVRSSDDQRTEDSVM